MMEWCADGPAWPTGLVAHGDSSGAGRMSARNPVLEADLKDVKSSLDGDEDAFARLIGRYQAQVFSQMWRFSRDPGVVEELVQDVFVEVFKSLKGFRGEAPFLHWTRKISTRVGYRYWNGRARQHRLQKELDRNYAAVLARPEKHSSSQAAEALYAVLATLAPKDRLVLTLIYFEECSAAEAAERTGWSETLVRVRAHRARRRLGKMLGNFEADIGNDD